MLIFVIVKKMSNNNNLSNIIYKELKQYKEEQNTNQNYEYGTVISVKDGVVHAYGLLNVKAGELVEFVDSNVKGLVLNLEKNNVGIVLFGNDSEVAEGMTVRCMNELMSVATGEGLNGLNNYSLGRKLGRWTASFGGVDRGSSLGPDGISPHH